MSDAAQARARSQTLKALRETHAESFERTQTLLRQQKKIQQQICQVIREHPKTVPEIAEATKLPASQVLWYLAAYKKYGIVEEAGMCGDYVLYQRAKEA